MNTNKLGHTVPIPARDADIAVEDDLLRDICSADRKTLDKLAAEINRGVGKVVLAYLKLGPTLVSAHRILASKGRESTWRSWVEDRTPLGYKTADRIRKTYERVRHTIVRMDDNQFLDYWCHFTQTAFYALGTSAVSDAVCEEAITFAKEGGRVTTRLIKQLTEEHDGTRTITSAPSSPTIGARDLIDWCIREGFQHKCRVVGDCTAGPLVVAFFRDDLPSGWNELEGTEIADEEVLSLIVNPKELTTNPSTR